MFLSCSRRFLGMRHVVVFIALCVLIFFINLAFPQSAYAFDVVKAIDRWFKGIFAGIASGLFGGIFSILKDIGVASPLGAEWDNIFGGGTGNVILNYAKAICDSAVKPMAAAVLSFVLLVQLFKISGRTDAHGTLPLMREIFFLVLTFSVYLYFIKHIDDIVGGIYTIINSITRKILEYDPSTIGNTLNFINPDNLDNVTYGDLFMAIIAGLLGYVIAICAFVLSLVLAYSRGIQLYTMMVFAPLPVAFLGLDDTRQWGVNFFKNFICVCLAGAIMVFVLLAYPFLLSAVIGSDASVNTGTVAIIDGVGGGLVMSALFSCFKVLAVTLLLVFALFHSGRWARDIMGG